MPKFALYFQILDERGDWTKAKASQCFFFFFLAPPVQYYRIGVLFNLSCLISAKAFAKREGGGGGMLRNEMDFFPHLFLISLPPIHSCSRRTQWKEEGSWSSPAPFLLHLMPVQNPLPPPSSMKGSSSFVYQYYKSLLTGVPNLGRMNGIEICHGFFYVAM